MTQIVPIDAIPNQSLSIQLDDVRYFFRFRDLGTDMSVDISIDDVAIILGQRLVGASPLIPYEYLEGDGGNFVLLTELGDIPYWDQFGVTQKLMYFSADELVEIRGD